MYGGEEQGKNFRHPSLHKRISPKKCFSLLYYYCKQDADRVAISFNYLAGSFFLSKSTQVIYIFVVVVVVDVIILLLLPVPVLLLLRLSYLL